MGDLDIGGQPIQTDSIIVILRCDLHIGRTTVTHRLIAAVVPKLELISLATQGQPDNLVA